MRRIALLIVGLALSAVLLLLVWTVITRLTIAQSSRTTSKPGEDRSEMVLIPGGVFDMGTERSRLPAIVQWIKRVYPDRNPTEKTFEDETPSHSVEIDSFSIDRYEVTNARYRTFVRATGHREPEGMAIVRRAGEFVTDSRFRPWSDSNFNRDQQRLKDLSTKADDLLTGTLKRSPSYRSELGEKTFEQLLRDTSQAAKKMCKLIKQSDRLMQKY